MRPYIAIEIDGVLSPYAGPLPAGHRLHDAESAAWQEWAVMVYPRPLGLRIALDPAIGRALADLPAELALASSYTPAELEPLLPALGWKSVPPLVPMRHTSTVHYMRVEDPGRSPDASGDLHWRAEEIASWARTHDRPVAWVRALDHHREELRQTAAYLSTVGPVLAYAVDFRRDQVEVGLRADQRERSGYAARTSCGAVSAPTTSSPAPESVRCSGGRSASGGRCG
ncbi:hypothetical protein [Streptomyces sp. NPDC088270]|uniref:hypothetical protein n=1 Tax=Streptomyces sp. NPDC088270 TaxID=3160990 RepID=UPI003426FA45